MPLRPCVYYGLFIVPFKVLQCIFNYLSCVDGSVEELQYVAENPRPISVVSLLAQEHAVSLPQYTELRSKHLQRHQLLNIILYVSFN